MQHDQEQMIYARQLGIPGWGPSAQDKVKKSTAFVAGAGGLGSAVLYYLAAAGVGNLIVSDYDTVDITNLNRQILHSFKRIGEFKVDSAVKTLAGFNPHVNIIPVRDAIKSSNVEGIAGAADIIVDCLDNLETRHVLNNLSVTKKIPLVHAGVSEMRGQITFIQPPETPCLACFLDKKEHKTINYILGATAGVIGSLQALEAIKYLAGIGPTLKNRLLFWDGTSMDFQTITIRRNPRCTVCGTAG